jgi:hypothetical protein
MHLSTHPVELIPTFLGAHSVPKGKTADEATYDILNNQLPELKVLCFISRICDIFQRDYGMPVKLIHEVSMYFARREYLNGITRSKS